MQDFQNKSYKLQDRKLVKSSQNEYDMITFSLSSQETQPDFEPAGDGAKTDRHQNTGNYRNPKEKLS